MRRGGFVLVGGRSARMGRDKALLPTASGTLLQEVALHALRAAGTVALIGDPDVYGHLGIHCVPDLEPGLGPLGGISTALASGRGELNLILACDMPLLEGPLLTQLFTSAESGDSRCVVPIDAMGRVHPLCGVYRQDCLDVVLRAQAERRLRLMDLLEELRAVRLPFAGILKNCNTPEEWAAVSRV